MDVQRKPPNKRRRNLRRVVFTLLTIATVVVLTKGLARLKPAAQAVERSGVLIGTVQRGGMIREVRGNGTLVPEELRVIAASTPGRVDQILVQPGMQVSAATVLIKLSNPELEQEASDAQYQLQAGEADFNNLKVRLDNERMSQQSVAASVRADFQQAKLQSETDEALAAKGLIPALNVKLSKVRSVELAARDDIEQERLKGSVKSAQAQQAAAQARLEQLRAQARLKRNQVGTLQVIAGKAGVLQQVQVEVGQQITPGTNLARVVEPQNLKAQLRIPEAQAKDIQLNQIASIDTRNGLIEGRVARIDPSVQQGTVTVDVMLNGRLPQGARPDLSVDGTIELERLTDVTYIERPAFGQSESVVELFKLEADGKTAVRVNVTLGRSSVNTVEVLKGLEVEDQVILSDMSAWNSLGRVVLK